MENKTCGECRHFRDADFKDMCFWKDQHREACPDFAPPTNGDKIRQGGDRAVADFVFAVQRSRCNFCAYFDHTQQEALCKRPNDKLCSDGLEEWLNAPAESEVKDE